MEAWLLTLADSPWVYPGMLLFALLDGFFPPVPSEVALLGLASLAVASGNPDLVPLLAVAIVGAFLGDLVAYGIGTRVDVHRIPLLRAGRGARMLEWAERSLRTRGRTFLLAGRFIPAARVAINAAAGALGYPLRRFAGVAAIGSTVWALYSAAIGIGAGTWYRGHPVAAVAVGVVAGLLIGLVLDAVFARSERRVPR
ncbi:VTT domain-containing protein [Actinotalea sp. M2MS4P-6]|uniref:DedA family protein n=1 Tax=Actinotalea sp. M2MS4P-6 TaxID=2983762 RepID=UPI0021E39438|nr:VTT domain-containing protein [Actinotalea sp. M2MS4P-6]MCV2394104.1 VTT domain-containing protein [Actinotalea sp. M2MS4P-6]